jgi:hypothetical protein
MRSLTRLLVLALAAQLWVSAGIAQDATLRGEVVGADGRPRPFALVQMVGSVRYTAMADAAGRFTITGVVPGSYVVRIRQGDNVETQQQTINPGSLTLRVKW